MLYITVHVMMIKTLHTNCLIGLLIFLNELGSSCVICDQQNIILFRVVVNTVMFLYCNNRNKDSQ